MQTNGRLPITWNASDFYSLDYDKTTIKTDYQLAEYANSGHNLEAMTIYNYFETKPMPAGVDTIREFFSQEFRTVGLAVNMFAPGTYVPYHNDLYQRFKTVNNIAEDSAVYRFIVMLEDGQPGQMLEVKNKVYHLWSAGEYIGWQDHDFHAFYNFSMQNRYAIQVTAVK